MNGVQVLLVGLEQSLAEVESWLAGTESTLHLADDLDEATDLVDVTGASLLLVNRRLAGLDPLEVVARCHQRLGDGHLPFAFLDPVDRGESVVVRRHPVSGEFAIERLAHDRLGPLLRALVSPRSEPPPPCPAATPAIRDRLLEVGFNGKAEHGGRLFVVQTEVAVEDAGRDGARVAVRVTVFERGCLLWARMHPVMLRTNPLAELEARAAEIHQQVIDRFSATGRGD
jgi:hypothetical protein